MRTIIIWGAGRIGRGFVADIFNNPDWHTVFVDKDAELVNALNAKKRYTIANAMSTGIIEKTIENGFEAVHTSEAERLEQLFLEKDLLLDIALHEPVLPEAAGMIAPLIINRAAKGDLPMDIMMNVNMKNPDARFAALMRERLSGNALEYFNNRVGITGIFAMCISPVAPIWLREKDALALWNNGYHEQAISVKPLKCPAPVLPRLRLTEDIDREETRKLYTLNMAHALLCYRGLKLGLKTSFEAAKALENELKGALDEASAGLIKEFGFGTEEMDAWKQVIISLLMNPYIEDGLQRLGADSRRKLGATDRLAGPARLCLKTGRTPVYIGRAIADGFDYENPDEGTREVRAFCAQNGLRAALEKYCGLTPEAIGLA